MKSYISVACFAVLMASCSTMPKPTSQRDANLAAAHQLYDNFMHGKIDAVLAGLSDDIVWIIPGDSSQPFAGTWRGKSEWMKYLKGLDAMDLKSFEPKEFVADGDKVVVFGTEKYVVKSTGKYVEESWAQVMTFRNGKVVMFRSYDDTAAAAAGFR